MYVDVVLATTDVIGTISVNDLADGTVIFTMTTVRSEEITID